MNAPLPFAGRALRLGASDIATAADRIGCDEATIRAVLTVETGGAGGFLSDGSGRPRILFEAHTFGRATRYRFNDTHPDISRSAWDAGLYLGGAAEYERLARALELDRAAALESASWGLFQIMGGNWQMMGFADVEAFVAAQADSEANQLDAFLKFVRGNRLTEALRTRNWAVFARGYNGPSYRRNNYDGKLETAYRRALGTLPTVHVTVSPGTQRPVLRVGDVGDAVRLLQQKLQLEEPQLRPDGIFGRATEAAVIRFQARARLAQDGVVGARTWQALEGGPPAEPRPFP